MINILKSRFFASGDQKLEGVNFFETYYPIVQWTNIPIILILDVLLGLKSKQGYKIFTCKCQFFLRRRRGKGKNKAFKLKNILYGLRQIPYYLSKYLAAKVEACGLAQSKLDPCLFFGDKEICTVYVDGLCFWTKYENYIHGMATKLHESGVDLEQEDDPTGFLGATWDHNKETGFINMRQDIFIDCIV